MGQIRALHLGCGPIRPQDKNEIWLNVDIDPVHKPDILMDVTKLPWKGIEPESFDVIWSCHMLEHLSYPGGSDNCLKGCFCALKKNGILRIAVPDLELIASYYLSKSASLNDIYGGGKFWYKNPTRGERFNYFLREWGHRIIYDEEMLAQQLLDAGFVVIKRQAFMRSDIENWHHDRLEGESLYMEARKP